MAKAPSTARRKDQHVDLCLTRDVSSGSRHAESAWNAVEIPHCALPEMSLSEVNLETEFLGHRYSSPILISSMTGGTPKSDRINQRLAKFAQAKNIPMGIGSQRLLIEKPALAKKSNLRKFAPKAKLFANIGAVQLNFGVSIDDIRRLIDSTESDGLFIHLNALQEAIQSEGDRDFSALIPKLEKLRAQINVPMILKETGCGLDPQSVRQARHIGFDAVETSGKGGTHWGYIEGLRSPKRRDLGELFRNWGIPSPQAITLARQSVGPDFPIIGSGGIRSGLDAARALYLGADFCGLALPFLQAASKGEKALEDFYAFLTEALRVSLFCSASKNPKELKGHGPIGKN